MKKMKKKKAVIISIAVIFLYILFVLFPLMLGGIDGSFGIRPRSHRCIGIVISNKRALNTFPKGDVAFNFLGKSYVYRIDETRMRHDVCIGQDIWYGE